MKLDKLLQSQGFGSRKYCQALILQGAVQLNGEVCTDIKYTLKAEQLKTLTISIFNQDYPYYEKVYLALFKPAGYECSHQPTHHQSVFDLLPDYLKMRGVQCVGRLDQDTTGLLLLTDDGKFLQKMTHPRQHIGKSYRVYTADQIHDEILTQLADGVQLHHEDGLFQADELTLHDEHCLDLTIYQGVYHQVKRMFASVGHKVVNLHRFKMGQLTLDELNLISGEWCYLTEQQLLKLNHKMD